MAFSGMIYSHTTTEALKALLYLHLLSESGQHWLSRLWKKPIQIWCGILIPVVMLDLSKWFFVQQQQRQMKNEKMPTMYSARPYSGLHVDQWTFPKGKIRMKVTVSSILMPL